MKYLVTGSAGFIGYHLVKTLLRNNENFVFAIDKKRLNLKHKNLKVITKNINNLKKFPKVDMVFHLAAFNGTKYFYTKPFNVIDQNILSTLKLVKYYKDKKLIKFITAGSSEAYAGAQIIKKDKNILHNEEEPIIFQDIKNPRWSYSTSKFMSEIITINSGLPYIILRYFNVYGPRQKDHFIPEFIKRIKKKKYELYGFKNTRSFIYIDDAIKATIKASNISKNNEIINIGSDIETKIIDVARLIMRILKINKKKLKLFSAPKGSVLKRKPDISKLEKIIGNKNFLSLEEGIKLLIKKK